MIDVEVAGKQYEKQRSGAAKRGIAWEFSFLTWLAVWANSGKWELRGIRYGQYVMGRFGDAGPYSPSNVYICTSSDNISYGALLRRGFGRNGERPEKALAHSRRDIPDMEPAINFKEEYAMLFKARKEEILTMRSKGMKLREIAAVHEISKQRVGQILAAAK